MQCGVFVQPVYTMDDVEADSRFEHNDTLLPSHPSEPLQ
eukprot:COSAG06_NODE_29261_length_559_cov_2.628261_1_plen_38_part_01